MPKLYLTLLSVFFALVFVGCSSGGSSSSSSPPPSLENTTFYEIGHEEIGVLELHTAGEATLQRKLIVEGVTEVTSAQWQIEGTTLAVDVDGERHTYRIDHDNRSLVEGDSQWQHLVTPSPELIVGDFWLAPFLHFHFDADGSGTLNQYVDDEVSTRPLSWEIAGDKVVIRSGLSIDRWFIVDTPAAGHLSVIVFSNFFVGMDSMLFELQPFVAPTITAATREQLAGQHFHGQFPTQDQLLTLNDDHTYQRLVVPRYGADFSDSFEETGNWSVDESGALTLISEGGQQPLMARKGVKVFLEFEGIRYRSYEIVNAADVTDIRWVYNSGMSFVFEADGTGTAQASGRIPFTWRQLGDRIRLDVLGQQIDWLVTYLDRPLGELGVIQLTLGESGYTELHRMSLVRETLTPATADDIAGMRFYRLDERKDELLYLDENGWFESQRFYHQSDASSDSSGTWELDADGVLTLTASGSSRALFAARDDDNPRVYDGSAVLLPLRSDVSATDFIGQWSADGFDGGFQLSAEGAGVFRPPLQGVEPNQLQWALMDGFARLQVSGFPNAFDWYLTTSVDEQGSSAVLQCEVDASRCRSIQMLPFKRR